MCSVLPLVCQFNWVYFAFARFFTKHFLCFFQVNIKAKAIELKSEGHNVLQNDTFLEKRTFLIADKTGAIELTMWGLQHTIEIGSWYDFTSVSFRTFQGKKFLSTTKDTHVSSAICTDTTCTVEETTSESVTAEIIGAKVKIIHLCPMKHRLPDMPLSCTRVMCHRCDMYYKATVISVHTSAKLTIRTTSNDIKTVDIENQVIQTAVHIPHTATPDTITDSLLNLPTMTLTLHHNYVTQLTHPPAFPSTTQTGIPKITISPPTPIQSSELDELESILKEDFPSENNSPTKTTPPSPPHPLDDDIVPATPQVD